MFFLNPFVIAGIVIFALIFLTGIAFWIVFGIKKFKWALITSIVISTLFVMTAGMFSLRTASARIVGGGRALDQFTKIERIIDKKDFGMFEHRESFGLRKSLKSNVPDIKIEGIDKKDLEQIREHWDEIESITINADITVEYKK